MDANNSGISTSTVDLESGSIILSRSEIYKIVEFDFGSVEKILIHNTVCFNHFSRLEI